MTFIKVGTLASIERNLLEPDTDRLPRKRLLGRLHEGAKVVFHRSWRNEIPLIILLFISIIVCTVATFAVPSSILSLELGKLGAWNVTVEIATLFLIPIAIVGFLIHRLWDDRFIITEDHIVAVNGLLSLNLVSSRIHHAHARGIEVDRTLFQRIVGTGNIKVGSASHADQEIVMVGVRNPSYYQNVIETLMKENLWASIASSD